MGFFLKTLHIHYLQEVTHALETHYKQTLLLVRLTAVFQTPKSGTKFLWHQDTTEAAAVRKCVISVILMLNGNATTVRIAKKLGCDDFELKQKMDMLHFHGSLVMRRSPYSRYCLSSIYMSKTFPGL